MAFFNVLCVFAKSRKEIAMRYRFFVLLVLQLCILTYIDGGHHINAAIEVGDSSNSNIIISNGGVIDKSSNSSFDVPLGTTFQFNNGTIK